jgi:hypothetical protein
VLPPVPAAIGNALYSLGLDVPELPLSAERVLAAVDARDAPGAPGAPAAPGAPDARDASDARPERVP